MKAHGPLSQILILLILVLPAISGVTSGNARSPNIKVWAMDETDSYPVVLGTSEWVLIGTEFGGNFTKEHIGKKSLTNLLLQSIIKLSQEDRPRVAVFSGGDSSNIMGMRAVMKAFVTLGYIYSFDHITVSIYEPLDASLYALAQYDVVILDPPTCKGQDWQFVITEDSKTALARYLENGGKIVASAYLFVYWNTYPSSEIRLYNEDLIDLLFGGAKPDISTYSPRAIANSPLVKGETILTLNAATGAPRSINPLFHSFWKLEIPIQKTKLGTDLDPKR